MWFSACQQCEVLAGSGYPILQKREMALDLVGKRGHVGDPVGKRGHGRGYLGGTLYPRVLRWKGKGAVEWVWVV